MAPSPIVTATLNSAVLAVLSNIFAQAIRASRNNTPLTINPLPALQFLLFALLSTPPNFLWQDLLEATFPSYHPSPTAEALRSAAASDDAGLDDEARAGRLVEPRLNGRNTLVKTLLDQTVGAAVNTLLFSCFMHGVQMAVAHHGEGPGDAVASVGWGLLAPGRVRYAAVEWAVVWARARAEFWGLLLASWRFWPLVSVVNYVFLTSVEARSLVGSLAGLGWGVYISLVTGK
ncbi:hypothetical protein BT67DRAFT_374495 [Trichocladium antarcticum]|uniref:Uncharacterized protein n=1 Tax=Trichocladium antarcticum TaxID=1450529 RepID=A0AAN6UQF3_9PEZI|nr:hypothetical protein BT67DRAFT_374495 [Trichocladium antarcticum]